jgi:hypothetical protein
MFDRPTTPDLLAVTIDEPEATKKIRAQANSGACQTARQ